MSARDYYHNTVKAAIQKDGWTITHELKYRMLNNIYSRFRTNEVQGANSKTLVVRASCSLNLYRITAGSAVR